MKSTSLARGRITPDQRFVFYTCPRCVKTHWCEADQHATCPKTGARIELDLHEPVLSR